MIMWIPKHCTFFQEIVANSADAIKSCLCPSCCEKLKKIEDVLLSNSQPNNPEASNWITSCVKNLTID